jgi:biopolymer transport protein ExbD
MADADMTPMIDVVFQLIAFFMVIINFEATQADERVKLPSSDLARPTKVKPDQELVLNVGFIRDPEGKPIDPEPFVFYAGDEKIRISDMAAKLKLEAEFFQRKNQIADGSIKTTVIIRADAEVPTGMVQELIKLCRESKFEKFHLKAKSEEL